MRIKLRLGIQFDKPEEHLIHYFDKAGKGFQAYEMARLNDPNTFTESEVRQYVSLINKLGARMPYKAVTGLIQRQGEVELALSQIPATLTILNSYEEIPWKNIKLLFDACKVPHVSISRMTKILHKKRPHLIPILDKNIIVAKYLELLLRQKGVTRLPETEKAVYHIKELKKDMDENKETLIRLQQNVNSEGRYGIRDISVLRVMDIIIWDYFFYKK